VGPIARHTAEVPNKGPFKAEETDYSMLFAVYVPVSHSQYGTCPLLNTDIFFWYTSVVHDQLLNYILKLQNIKEGLTTMKSNPHSLLAELGTVSMKTCRVHCNPECQMCGGRERQSNKPMFSFVLPWITVLWAT